MARSLPRFDLMLQGKAQAASDIVKAGEQSLSLFATRKIWTTHKLEHLYELAYLRIFAAWEQVLESVFFRTLCGFHPRAGIQTLVSGKCFKSIVAAQTSVFGPKNTYLLWHKPQAVIDRCKQHIVNGNQELVVSSSHSILTSLATIRHRIAHDQDDGKRKFDAVALALSGKTYLGSRPGRFLRDWDTTTTPHRRRLTSITAELIGLAGQLV